MRPLIVGIILFLIWSFLSSWYYVNKIYLLNNEPENAAMSEEAIPEQEYTEMETSGPEAPELITIYFEYNQAEFVTADFPAAFISESMDFLQFNKESCILISGFTCSKGTEKYNLELGKRRAEEVKNFLMKQGFSDQCIKTKSYGESNPAEDNSTEEGRVKNRRAKLEIISTKTN